MSKSDEQWRHSLTPEQFHILREKGTERAFTGQYWDTKSPGRYRCAGCRQDLFSSQSKFDSGSGWPSFSAPIDDSRTCTVTDRSHGMLRVEVTCSGCAGHLGHVFDDGPAPTGKRYCINSAALNFVPEQ